MLPALPGWAAIDWDGARKGLAARWARGDTQGALLPCPRIGSTPHQRGRCFTQGRTATLQLGLEQSPTLPWTASAALGTLPTSHQPQEGSSLNYG